LLLKGATQTRLEEANERKRESWGGEGVGARHALVIHTPQIQVLSLCAVMRCLIGRYGSKYHHTANNIEYSQYI